MVRSMRSKDSLAKKEGCSLNVEKHCEVYRAFYYIRLMMLVIYSFQIAG
jgi:hypothetical protein